jgi:glycosyltransferase involved in cell wall biosynthesis
LADAGYRIHHLPIDPQASYPARLIRFLRAHRFELVHNHRERANFWTSLAAKGARIDAIVRTAHSAYPFRGGLRFERTAQRRLLRAWGVRTVAVSDSVASNEWTKFRNRTRVIYNWIDDRNFTVPDAKSRSLARASLALPSHARVVCSVGNCAPVKNHAVVLDALATATLGEVHYLHVGLEDSALSEGTRAALLGLADRCHFLGMRSDVPDVLAASDVFVMPSSYEGLGVAAIEALSTGIPCVLADSPGLRDLDWAEAPVTWVKPDPDSLARAIAEAIGQGRPDPSAAQESHRRAQQTHGVDRGVDEYIRLYAEVLNDRDQVLSRGLTSSGGTPGRRA